MLHGSVSSLEDHISPQQGFLSCYCKHTVTPII